jgi:hypothetical protein
VLAHLHLQGCDCSIFTGSAVHMPKFGRFQNGSVKIMCLAECWRNLQLIEW